MDGVGVGMGVCGGVLYMNGCTCIHTHAHVCESVVSTRMSSEFVYEFSENKGQFVRIRDKNIKFRSNSVSILNVTFA